MKLCKDCMYSEQHDGGYKHARCNAPQNMQPDLVAGGMNRYYEFCSTVRSTKDGCGLDAVWFESKPNPEFVKVKIPLLIRIFRTEFWEAK
jgi:hypothetical protein